MFSLAAAGARFPVTDALCASSSPLLFPPGRQPLSAAPLLLQLIGSHFSPPPLVTAGPAAFCRASEPITVIRAKTWVQSATCAGSGVGPCMAPFFCSRIPPCSPAEQERLAVSYLKLKTGANQQAERQLWAMTLRRRFSQPPCFLCPRRYRGDSSSSCCESCGPALWTCSADVGADCRFIFRPGSEVSG